MFKNYISWSNSGSTMLKNTVKSGVSSAFCGFAAGQKKAFMAVFLLLMIFSGQHLLGKVNGNYGFTSIPKSLQVLKSNVVAVDKSTETTNYILTQTSQTHQISSLVMSFFFDFYNVGQSTANADASIKLPVAALSTPENKNTTRFATFNIDSDTHILLPIVYNNSLENKSNNTNTFNN